MNTNIISQYFCMLPTVYTTAKQIVCFLAHQMYGVDICTIKQVSIVLLFKAADTPYFKQCLRHAVKRKANELADEQRLKKRALGAGPKPMIDEEDDMCLAKCIGM